MTTRHEYTPKLHPDGNKITIACLALTLIMIILVSTRIFTRVRVLNSFGEDDAFLILGTVSSCRSIGYIIYIYSGTAVSDRTLFSLNYGWICSVTYPCSRVHRILSRISLPCWLTPTILAEPRFFAFFWPQTSSQVQLLRPQVCVVDCLLELAKVTYTCMVPPRHLWMWTWIHPRNGRFYVHVKSTFGKIDPHILIFKQTN